MKLFFWFFLFLSLPLFGQEELKARAFFEAGDYPHAKSIYEDLLDAVDGWKKEIIEYNIATTLLAAGRPEEAISRLEALSDKDVELPLLQQRLSSNLALARTMVLEESLKELKNNSKNPTKNYNQVYLLFRSALQEINKAKASWCKLQAVEGASDCPPSFYLQQMELAVKGRFDQFFRAYSAYRAATLDKLLYQFPKGPLKEDLQQLLAAYELVLINDPLQAKDLSQVLEAQAKLESTLKSSDSAINADYEKSQEYLRLSIDSIHDSHPIKAHLFAEVARFYLQETLEKIEPAVKAANILENAIAKQEFLLLMENLKGQIPGDEKGLGNVDRLMPELQLSILNTAGLFPAAVVTQQKEIFSGVGKEKADRCQCRPWDEVIPLFSQGYAHAERAYRHLEKEYTRSVRRLQKSAIDSWKEALQKMHAASAVQQQQKQQQEEQLKPLPQKDQLQENRQNVKFNEILRMVQDMENDDRSQPQQIKSTGSKREDRPW